MQQPRGRSLGHSNATKGGARMALFVLSVSLSTAGHAIRTHQINTAIQQDIRTHQSHRSLGHIKSTILGEVGRGRSSITPSLYRQRGRALAAPGGEKDYVSRKHVVCLRG
ncbi:hypothetical protein T484DRAFT_2092120 [Baffinella frigidus]|nr:hypothetical protein T484DRAFT_2092120 [Cryptophyta sp. CCMP2293]